jgi:hypothetical protein
LVAFPIAAMHAMCPAQYTLLHLVILMLIGEVCKSQSSSLCNLLCLLTSSLLEPRDQVSHPYKTIGKIVSLYIFIFIILDSRLENERFWTEWYQELLVIFSGCNFDLLVHFPDIWM